jgi:phosphocarrier protein HPr
MAVEKTFTVTDEVGIHARPATQLVQKASQYNSEILIQSNGKSSNLKSIMGVMAMGISKGSTFKIRANGYDEIQVIETIDEFLKSEGIAE